MEGGKQQKSAIRIREIRESVTQQKFYTHAGVFSWRIMKKEKYKGLLDLNLLSGVGVMQQWAPRADKNY